LSVDPFGAKDPFASAFAAPAKPTVRVSINVCKIFESLLVCEKLTEFTLFWISQNDPFASAFGQTKSEPFDAFGRSKSVSN